MKAIETLYRGYRFRSRLEARWAVFFDAIEADWDYEPEGFDLGDGDFYLPDFFLKMQKEAFEGKMIPGSGHWIEIKGIYPTDAELRKLTKLATMTNHTACLFIGAPGKNGPFVANFRGGISQSNWGWSPETEMTQEALLNINLGVHFGRFGKSSNGLFNQNVDETAAARLATRARFEFGESGV